MYGSRNPVLRHFGADELATQGTLQAIEERRLRGEYVAPSETVIARPTPGFDEFFEFDRPVPSGIAPHARDFLVEEASASPASTRRAGTAAASYGSPAPSAYGRGVELTSHASSPPPASYSSPEPSYQDAGAVSSDGGERSSGQAYDPRLAAHRQSYGAQYSRSGSGSPGSGRSPARSSRSPESSLQQPPFRAGVPELGPRRRAGLVSQTGTRRRTTSSNDRSRSPSRQPSTIVSTTGPQPERQPSHIDDDDETSGGAAGRTAPRARGVAAKISGRPTTAGPGRGSPGGAAAAGRGARRPSSAAASGARTSGAAAGARAGSAPRVPAWAPAAGVSNLRLDEMDEAARVAVMLNDPSTRQDAPSPDAPPLRSPRDRPVPSGDGGQPQSPQPHGSPGPYPGGSPGPYPGGSPGPYPGGSPGPYPGGSPGPYPGGSRGPYPGGSPGRVTPGASPGYGGRTRASDVSDQYFGQYRLRKHREPQGVPDYRYSQPRSYGAHAPVEQRYFSFDEAHPALAEQHYARSPAQERLLQAERRKLQQERMRAARAAARNRVPSPMPTATQLAADVDRLTRVREAGRARLRELEREGEALRQETRQVQQRALDAIARSERMTAAGPRSTSASPPHRRSRSPSPSAYYSGAGGYSYSRSPSASPGRYRPASASPGRAFGPGYVPSYSARVYGEGPYGASQAQRQQYQQQYGQQYQQAYHGAAQGRPVSAPPPMAGSPPPRLGEAHEILAMIDSVERLPQHEQLPLNSGDTTGDPAAPAADHLARAGTVAAARRPMGLLNADEQRIAMGEYDRSRYEEYQRQTDLEMQRRALEGGYDSDLERDEAAAALVHDAQKEAEDEAARRRAAEDSWRLENEQMDEYRQRFGPEDGYGPGLAAQPSALSDAEVEMLQQPFVPLVSPELTLSPNGGYASEGADAAHPHRRTRRRLFFKSTVPEPFQFEAREKARPKPISKVKLEQDLAIRRKEEEAARKERFRASPVPAAVMEPRYERMLLEAEAKRQFNQQRLEELASMMNKPFSFHKRDEDREDERAALARAAKDPNRFQVAFRARDVPSSTQEERFRLMMLEMEAKREATRRRVEEAHRAAKERAVQQAQERRQAADRAYRERLRAVDPALHPYPPKPLGVVPDFNSLHRQFEVNMARARANTRKRVTVPQEFKLNGATPDEQAARAQKAEERRQRIILDMQMDAELLPEARWPHKSPRGKVRRTPPPAYLVEWMTRSPGPTAAANARRSSTAVAAQDGAYRTRAERDAAERKASEKLRAEQLRRADRLLKAAQERREKEQALQQGEGGGEFGLESDVGATVAAGVDQGTDSRAAAARRRAAVVGRQDNPEVYVEARHAQIERRVREEVENVLLDQGIDAFRYVEGVAGDARGGRAAKKPEQ